MPSDWVQVGFRFTRKHNQNVDERVRATPKDFQSEEIYLTTQYEATQARTQLTTFCTDQRWIIRTFTPSRRWRHRDIASQRVRIDQLGQGGLGSTRSCAL